MDEFIDQNGDPFFETQSPAIDEVRLSHSNNKSSVLCPQNQNITGQYLALQQLEAHQRMISRAKGIVDTSAPLSMQSYISVANRQKKRLWHQPHNQSCSSDLNGAHNQRPYSASRIQTNVSEEEDNVSLNASSVSKAVQTGMPFVTFSSKTADKISWYLEALSQGELLASPFVHSVYSQNSSHQPNKSSFAAGHGRRVGNGDILETHLNCFVKSKKPFSPRIVANIPAKSKIKEMRCYNPPLRRKKHSSTDSSDTFESYQDSDIEDKGDGKHFNNSSEEVETQINRKSPIESSIGVNTRLHDYLLHHSRERYYETNDHTNILNRNKEDKYLDFLSKVTEDILRSGVYSDRAIQQAFEFHMQFYQEDENKDNLQSLLAQVLEGLKISGDDSEEVLSRRDPISMSFSQPSTPPEREITTVLPSMTDSLKPEQITEELNFSLQSMNQALAQDIQSNKITPQDNDITFRLPDS